MPTLNWMGKDKVVTYDQNVPFHVLNHVYNFGGDTENKIIHGDNLLALKSLLPLYEGKVKCIYIDPPYNTGNEGWVYNDNVNDPRIKKWLGQVVGREGEDFSRHDKWLCMMYPRLKLLKRLLADDGAIFISIDDNEVANLKLICDEIFGSQNFVATFSWRKRTAKSDVPHGISQDCEYILCYAKSYLFQGAVKGKERKYFLTEDFPNRAWRFHDLTKQTTASERPNSFFKIVNPKNGKEYPANPNSTWRITKETFQKYYDEDRIIFPGDYDFLKISKPVLRYWKEDDIKKAGKNFGMVAASTYLPAEVGMTQDGTKEITEIFGEKNFNFPKPSTLIRHIVAMSTDKNSIVLDSFAGSGTTAHAVINLNREDGGERKFILVEMEDYAENITAERVRRVGGSFDFYEVGEEIFIDDELNENIPLEKIREYIWTTDTRTKYVKRGGDCEEFLGVHRDIAYYFHYDGETTTTLDNNFLAQIKTRASGYVIYAESCAIDEEFLLKHHIEFRKIPRDILKN